MPDQATILQLIEQLPPTDRELQKAAEQKATEQKTTDQAGQTPNPSGPTPNESAPASKVTGPDPARAHKLFDEILGRGRAAVEELASHVRVPGESDFLNYKASYLLHGLVVYCGHADRTRPRELLTQVLASQVSSTTLPSARRKFFLRELQWIAESDASKILTDLLHDSDLCEDAAAALTAIGPTTAPNLNGALSKASGKNRVVLLQLVGELRVKSSADALRLALQDPASEVRLLAGWALARIAAGDSSTALLKMVEQEKGYSRSKAVRNCILLADELAAAGRNADAIKIYRRLEEIAATPQERYVRDLATRALSRLSPEVKSGI